MLESWHVLRLLAIISVALTALAVAGSTSAEVARHPCVPKSSELRFRAADGTRLAGIRLGRGRKAVVLAHQSRGDACQWAGYARRLARLGYLVIAIDFRGYGDSQTRGGRAAGRLAADVAAAAKVARARGAQNVFAMGASMGGTAVLSAAANVRPQLSGVISPSCPAVFTYVDALRTAPRLTAPALYIVGRDDADFVPDAERLHEATAAADKALHVLPVGYHGVELVRSDPQARALVEDFIRSH